MQIMNDYLKENLVPVDLLKFMIIEHYSVSFLKIVAT